MEQVHSRAHQVHRKQQGSALLVTLMVMVGLSIIGLGYVAISETESAISINERNAAQVRELAEAGARAIVETFQDPEWAEDVNLLPPTINAIKTDRIVDGASIGRYQPGGARLFDKPHKATFQDRFWGTEDTADVWINNTKLATAATTAQQQWLNDLNKTLFNGDYSAGRITEIRVYAPPFSGGVLQDGFYRATAGIRLGLCTIAVTATKCRNDTDADPCTDASPDSRVIARRTVRIVISEWPFPGPSGPVQTNANLGTNGNVQVHWGQITATGTMKLKRPFGSLPWHDAYTTVNYQYGYNSTAAAADNPWISDPAGDYKVQYDWIYALAGKTLDDPWYQARTRGDFTGDGAAGPPVAYRYDLPELDLYDVSGANTEVRAIFQSQTKDVTPDYKSVLFPKFDYNFWKDTALTGDDQDNVFYLSWVKDDVFRDKDGNEDTVEDWINVPGGAKSGFYFFDTRNGLNPQNGGPGILTPSISVKGNPFQAQGFIYLNTEQWDSAGGAKGVDGYYAAPGEPFKDIGFWKIDEITGDYILPKVLATDLAGNGKWDFQDAPGGTADVFDYFVESRTFNRPDDVAPGTTGGAITLFFLKPYFDGCTPGVNCSEPHEPFLNLEYNTIDTVGGINVAGVNSGGGLGNRTDVTMQWSNANAGKGQTLPKTTSDGKPTGTPISCNVPPADKKTLWEQCTSNSYDKHGPLVPLDPGLNGVLYVEGEFEQTGNMIFFGSILAEGDFGKAGSPDVWFDERLIKDEWPPRDFKFPRVFISAVQSD
jgi:hypothetical protein